MAYIRKHFILYKIKILRQQMPRYTIIEEPQQYSNDHRFKRSRQRQDPYYVERLRQILEDNRKNNQYYANDHAHHPIRVRQIGYQRYETEKSDNQQDIVYVVHGDNPSGGYDSGIHLPKLKKRQRVGKPIKYSYIDNNEKLIIRNYMNAKLIQFKDPRKQPKKRRNHTLDSVGELPDNSRRKYFKYQRSTPIDGLNGVSYENQLGPLQTKEIVSRTQTVDYHDLNKNGNHLNVIQPHHVRTPSSGRIKSEQDPGFSTRSIVNEYSDSTYSKKQPFLKPKLEDNQKISSKLLLRSKEEEWQLIDPLNLQTYFFKMKKVINPSPENSKMQRVKQKIPRMPSREQMSNFIKNYVPEFDEIKIEQLIKSDSFQIIQDDTVGQASFYFGETQNDKKNGKGILIAQKLYFEGFWLNDQKQRGLDVSEMGKYKGQFKDGIRSGKGQFFWSHGEYYSGEWKNGKKNGSGYWKSLKSESYMGEWKNGNVTGYGVHTMKSGQKYEGQFVNFLKHGFGRQVFPNGDNYQGRYVQGQAHGTGKYTWKNGTIYQGQFVEGFRQGKGVISAPNHVKFEGTFKDEVISGMGRLQSSNGDVFNGMFSENKKNGHGILDLKMEKRIIKGVWKNNELLREQQ